MGTWTSDPYYDEWEGFLQMERIAAEDQRLARAGLVKLQRDGREFYKHIDDLTREDRWPRIEAERTTTAWLRGRIEAEKIAAQLREKGWNQSDA